MNKRDKINYNAFGTICQELGTLFPSEVELLMWDKANSAQASSDRNSPKHFHAILSCMYSLIQCYTKKAGQAQSKTQNTNVKKAGARPKERIQSVYTVVAYSGRIQWWLNTD